MKTPWRRRHVVALLIVLLAIPALAAGQIADPKTDFAEALAQFGLALDGRYGDEGPRVLAALEAMSRGLGRWDATIRAYEQGIEAATKGAEPKLAALAHMAIGGVYMDRNRPADALREFTAAAALDPGRVDAYTLQGLANTRLPAPNAAAAVAAFEKAASLDPFDVVGAYLLARQLAASGRTDEALKTWPRVVENQKRHAGERTVGTTTYFMRFGIVEERSGVEAFFPPAVYAEGFALLGRGQYAQAVASLQSAAARDPLVADQTNRYGMRRAADALRDGALDTAVEQLRAAIEISPDRSEPHRILGLVYAAAEQTDRATGELRAAIKLNATDERARLALADLLTQSEQYPAAEQALRETIAALPASGRAHYTLARLFQRQNRNDEALKEFEQAVTFGPLLGLNGIYQAMGALAASRQNFDASLAAYTRRVDVHPNDAAAHLDLAETQARVGRDSEALAEFAVALTIDPERAAAYAGQAQAYLRLGRNDDAVEAARRALELDPTHRQARYALGTALLRLDKTDEGQRELEEFQRLQASDAAAQARELEMGALKREASVASAAGDHAKAVQAMRKALALQPDEAVSHLNLGIALLRAGQPQEAVTRLQAAASLNGPPDVHRYLAEAYAALKQDEASRRELEAYDQQRREQLRRAGAAR